MGQIFHPSTNTIAKATIFGGVLVVAGIVAGLAVFVRSPANTGVNVVVPQPVQFSHRHHVTDDGIDCRYCHTSVETSAFAGVPPTQTCMNCHSYIWAGSPQLELVRQSYQTGQPLVWNRVHDLPDFTYFNHSIHLNKGVGCVTCHGRVDEMPLMWKEASLQMSWCLDCHRHPEKYVRPREYVFDMDWQPSIDQETLGNQLVEAYGIRRLTDCSTCHR